MLKQECRSHHVSGTWEAHTNHPQHWKLSLITCPNTKQYNVIPMAQTSKACRGKEAQLDPQQTVREQKISPKNLKLLLNTFPEKIFLVSESVSGAMKAGVPTVLVKRASAPLNSLLTPKSAILTCPSSPTRRLEGLISRWIIF